MLFGKYINKFYLKYLWCFIIGVAFLVAVDVLHVIEPEKLGEVVGLLRKLTLDPNNQDIIKQITDIGLFIILIGFLMFFGRIVWRYSLFFAATRIEAGLRKQMYEKAEKLSPYFYHQNSVGTILNWFTSDLEEILEFFKWGTIQLVDAFFLSTFVLIKMFKLSLPLSLGILIPIILIAIWSFTAENLFTAKWKQRQESGDKLYEYVQESFTGIRVIKAFVKESQQIRAFDKIARNNKDIDIGVTRVFVLFERMINIVIAFIFAGLMGVGGYMVYQSWLGNSVFGTNLDLTDLVTFIGYFDTLLWPIFALGSVISMHARAKASLGRITNFLDTPVDVCNAENPILLKDVKGKIEFKDLCFKYPDMKHDHLKHLNFVINPGENVGVVGRIGCGKTTISNLICRLFNPNKGTLFIDDTDILDIDLTCLRDCISYVPQDNFLFSDSLEHNIGFGKKGASFEEIQAAAQFSDVDKDIVEFKDGYKTITGERGTTLSGGQKQRVSMARAYLKDAPIMIMDDSVSAVDVKTEETILSNIKKNRAGKTTIIVASRVSTVSKLDKVIVLNNGELEAFGTPAEVLKTSKTYAKMHMLQELEKEKEGGK